MRTAVVLGLLAVVAAGAVLAVSASQRQPETAAMPAASAPPRSPSPPLQLRLDAGSGVVYGVSGSGDLRVSEDAGIRWVSRSGGLPRRQVYPFSALDSPRLTAIATDPFAPFVVVVALPQQLFRSMDAGRTWQAIPLTDPVDPAVFLTSVTVVPGSAGSQLIIGTSFSGLFRTDDSGASWRDLSDAAPFLRRGAGFHEEVSGLATDPAHPNQLLLAEGFGMGIFIVDLEAGHWRRVPVPGDRHRVLVSNLAFVPRGDGWDLSVSVPGGQWRRAGLEGHGAWQFVSVPSPPVEVARATRAAHRAGLYVAPGFTEGEPLASHLRFAREHGLNSLVVDVKDDLGRLTYDSRLETPAAAGAIQPQFRLEELLAAAHRQGLYVIGRLVVFKDRQLYHYSDGDYAVWDQAAGQPWGRRIDGEVREHWVDPYASFVWEYNVDIAAELANRGIDEVQFDYIRFPSDGNTAAIQYRHQRDGMTKIDALESFLAIASARLQVPISADVFGFNAWFHMGGWIGQNLTYLAPYLDAVSPMFYPSHFPLSFMAGIPYRTRARLIYQEGSRRAQLLAGPRVVIRPYVQAFLLGAELKMDEAAYRDYLMQQMSGAEAGGASGYILWNASNRYYMVPPSLGGID